MHDEGEDMAGVRIVMGPIRRVILEGMGTVVIGTALERPIRGERRVPLQLFIDYRHQIESPKSFVWFVVYFALLSVSTRYELERL